MGQPVATYVAPPPPASLPWQGVIAVLLRRPGARRVTSGGIALVVVAGLAFFAYPTVTDIVGSLHQRHVVADLHSTQLRTQYEQGTVPTGAGLTLLTIDNPRVHVSVMVVQGTTAAALEAGAGHYDAAPSTPLPCRAGNVGIAGHRTTYGRPFNRIDQMRVGDTVTLTTPVDTCTYRVVPAFAGHANPWIVSPSDIAVVSQAGLRSGHWLTLTSCNPKGSNAQRIVLRLAMVSDHPTTSTATAAGATASAAAGSAAG